MVDADSDIAPVTPMGQVLSTAMLLLGGCMFGVPIAIIATGFENKDARQVARYYHKIYTKQDEAKYGVVAYKIELL